VAGTYPGIIISAAQRQAAWLHKSALAVAEGTPVSSLLESGYPRLHFSRKGAVEIALRNFSPARLVGIIDQLGTAALDMRKQATLASAIGQAPAEDVYANGYVVRAFLEETGFAVPGWIERALDFGAFKMADFVGLQVTGGSTSTRGTGAFGMRLAGASAKAMLLEAGAQQFGVDAEELTARDSRILHAPSGRSS